MKTSYETASSSFEAAVVFANIKHLSQQHSTTTTSSITASTTAASQLPHVLHSRQSKITQPSYHRNQQYSIIGLTNAAGTLVERYSYSAYGTLGIYDASGTVRTTSTYANRYTYTGREYDPDLNLYHFRARWYDPSTGGFISRDPLGYVDGMSLYRGYFGVYGVDPTGLELWTFSGINNSTHGGEATLGESPMIFEDYLGEKIIKDYGVTPDRRIASQAGNLPAYRSNHDGEDIFYVGGDDFLSFDSYYAGLDSQERLDADAQKRCKDHFDGFSLCKRPRSLTKQLPGVFLDRVKILVLMLGPKTKTSLHDSTNESCCDVSTYTWLDVNDGVPNQGIGSQGGGVFKQSGKSWVPPASGAIALSKVWGDIPGVYDSHAYIFENKGKTGSENRHGVDNYFYDLKTKGSDWSLHAQHHSNNDGWVSPRNFKRGPWEVYMDKNGGYDHVVFCHSQGCNIAMNALRQICRAGQRRNE